MKTALKRIGNAAMDPFGVQLYFILFSFLSEIPLAMAYVQLWKKVGLLWAAAVIVYDLFTKRRCLKARFALPVMGLLVAYAVTAVTVYFRYPGAFQETYLDWFCSVAVLLVLYPPVTEDREQGMRRLSVINWLLVGLTSVVAVAGVSMFLLQMGGYFYSDITDYNYPIGFVAKRLTGLYRNAIYPTPLIGVGAAVTEWVRLKGKAILPRVLLGFGIAVNVWQIILSNSRSLTYALALFGGLVTILLVRRLVKSKTSKAALRFHWRAWLAGGAATVLMVALVLTGVPMLRRSSAYLPPKFAAAFGTVENPFAEEPDGPVDDGTILPEAEDDTPAVTPDTEPVDQPVDPAPSTPVDFDRDIPEVYGALTGRPIIWRQGLSYFKQNPLLGYGPYALKDSIRISETSTERLAHFHNIFLQSLVSVGVFGSLFFFVLLLGAAWRVLRKLLSDTADAYHRELVAIGTLLASLLLMNMADTTLFFLSKNSEFVFWTYLGYAMLLVGDAPYRMDAPLRALDRGIGHILRQDR